MFALSTASLSWGPPAKQNEKKLVSQSFSNKNEICKNNIKTKKTIKLKSGAITRKNRLLQRSKAPPCTSPQMYRGNGLNSDFTIFCCGTFYSIILIVICSANHLKSGKVYLGYSFTC